MAGSGPEVKECWYSVLGVERTATPQEIRSAYRKEALRWHPDKIQQGGASAKESQEATVRFQNIVQAYEVLSDPVERAWYDKYRSEILSSGSASKDFEFNVFSFFSPSAFSGFGDSGKGFYKVYKDVFANIHKKEQAFAKAYGMGPIGEAPSIGSPTSPMSEVEEFYKYWTGFSTVKDFSWCDEYQLSQAPNRKVRRIMEDENAKIRKRERREFNDAVRDLASFVKKRDKRWLERQVQLQQLQREKDQQFQLRKKKIQQEKIAKARAVQEQEWTKIPDNALDEDDALEDVNEGSYEWKNGDKKKTVDEDLQEFYCIICSKRFRSEKQWKNHEKSKKHIDRVSVFKQSFLDEDELADALVKEADLESHTNKSTEERPGMTSGVSDGESKSKDQTEESLQSSRRQESADASFLDDGKGRSKDLRKEYEHSTSRVQQTNDQTDTDESAEDEDDETLGEDNEDSILAAMMNSHKSRLAATPAEGGATRDADVHETLDESREQSAGTSSSETDGINASGGDDDDEESIIASMRNYSGSQFSSEVQIGTDRTGTAEVPIPEAGSIAVEVEEQPVLTGNIGKSNSKRRLKAEKQHVAARERYDDLLKELSFTPEESGLVQNVEAEELQLGSSFSVKDLENPQPAVNPTKKKLQRGQKKGKLEVPGKQGVPKVGQVAPAVSQQSEHMGKKGGKKGKKGKGASNSASNTCDTCGEDFASRSQLFRHISSTNHATLRAR